MRKLVLFTLSIAMLYSIASFAFGLEGNFVAHLSGAQEVDAVETAGRGQAVFQLNEDGSELNYKIVIANTENITMAHIHMAPAGQNGPPVVWLYPEAPPAVPLPGRFDGILAVGAITEANLIGNLEGQPLSSLLDRIKIGRAYVNVHTEQYPGGEIRGQIMTAPTTMFKVMIENISSLPEFSSSGVFNTPDGAEGPGPLLPGSAYKFAFGATAGSKLSFATMFVQSNDLFYAPSGSGIPLFEADGTPVSGDVTAQVMLWDAGSEVNQKPGIGLAQAPRQSGPNTGADENSVVQLVNDGYTYPETTDVLSITITPGPDNEFEVSIKNISEVPAFSSSGVFNTPSGAVEPGPLAPGAAYTFNVSAAPGSKLSFATMFVQSNDLFYAPGAAGIPLFDADGVPLSGDVTAQVMLWDAGTEVNQEPGVGADQAPRQSGPNTGADENGVAQLVDDGYTYPDIADVLNITVTPVSETEFAISIENISNDDTFLLAPGVWVVHPEDNPLFTAGQPDLGEGLEALAEDGNPATLAAALESRTGVPVILAPGVWVVHPEDNPLFTAGQLDLGEGLEALAEDGNPATLATALGSRTGVPVILAPGVWAAHTDDAPLFTVGQPEPGEGLEALAEDGNPSGLAIALNSKVGVISSGVFNTPMGAAEPAPVFPGSGYEFYLSAFPGSKLSFATMFVQSNDLFYAPDEAGIALFNAHGGAVSGDVTSKVMLWDGGTEVNQRPGVGVAQAPRQAGANTGADENGVVQLVNDGYTYPNILTSIRVTIAVVEPPPGRDYSNVFFMNLSAGLNMISLPLEPQESFTARSFAEMLDATVVIEYDADRGRFVGFIPDSEGGGFAIEGGMGYIVNRLASGVVTFVGAAWMNEPPVEAAPPVAERDDAWAFIVTGKFDSASANHQRNSQLYTVTVTNLRTGDIATDSVKSLATGSFAAVFADLNRNPVVQAGDAVEIVIKDSTGRIVAGPVGHQISIADIQQAFANITMRFGDIIPEKNLLLQNYPNPFNPETWIPYQLTAKADVSVKIYNSAGKLVRSLSPGNKDAGIYTQKTDAAYWNGKSDAGEKVASGIYFYTIQAGDFTATKKMIIAK